jgi:hypothetical protein
MALGVVGVVIEQGVELAHEYIWLVVQSDQVGDLFLESGGLDGGHRYLRMM